MHRTSALLIAVLLALHFSVTAAGQAVHKTESASQWQPGIFYSWGKVVTFEKASYRCMYSHTAVSDWTPPTAVALWQPVGTRTVASKQSSKIPPSTTKRVFAPYIHMSETNNNLPEIQAASGLKFFTLAFIVSDGGCSPAWQGETSLPLSNEKLFSERIDAVRKSGGDVIISFGGYVGKELALACPDAATLTAVYQAVVDKYKARSLDFDIEASAASDAASIERRSDALSRLATANPGLQISFTVPVFATGMPQTALDLLKSAQKNNVPVSIVNLMTMDYGQPVPEGNMGPVGIVAVEKAISQLRSLGLTAAIGITPMIGRNDTVGETFTLTDANAIFSYAQSNSAVRRLSMWSVGRDRGGCIGTVSPTCSGIDQVEWAFTRVFNEF